MGTLHTLSNRFVVNKINVKKYFGLIKKISLFVVYHDDSQSVHTLPKDYLH